LFTLSFDASLSEICGKGPFYITCGTLDWSFDTKSSFTLKNKDFTFEIPLPFDAPSLKELFGKLEFCVEGGLVIGWGIKNLFSYFLGRTGKSLGLNATVLELKILENYLGLWNEAPGSFLEAIQRLKALGGVEGWDKAKNVYNSIYKPLVTTVVPSIETLGVVDRATKKHLYSYYEIAGQQNGRLRCEKVLAHCFNPHCLLPEEKGGFYPPMLDYAYLLFDYHHMEVTVLQWLSKDPVLGHLLASGQDVYDAIWERITGGKSNENLRNKCKLLFLPMIYGQGVKTLAEVNKIPVEMAGKLVDKMHKTFSVAFNWIEEKQGLSATDHFGRRRDFDQPYKARNFVVQSPAALFCLLKLSRLYASLPSKARLCMSIHDGYTVLVPEYDYQDVARSAVSCLESEEEMFPGLYLKTSCKFGKNLEEVN
jgi:hypothetical protein